MKPVDYYVVIEADSEKFNEAIKEKLEQGFVFAGDLQMYDGCLIKEMIKLETPTIVPMKDLEKGNKK